MAPKNQCIYLLSTTSAREYVADALEVLALLPQAAAVPVYKTVKSALANAEENYALEAEDMIIAEIKIDEGPRLRRARYGARGRFKPIKKRMSHITVLLEEEIEDAD